MGERAKYGALFAVLLAFFILNGEAYAQLYWTQSKRPSVRVSASETSVARGQEVTISWSSENADKCKGPGTDLFWHKDKSGSMTFKPVLGQRYEVKCKNSEGESSDSVKVNVEQATIKFSVNGHSGGTLYFDAPARLQIRAEVKTGWFSFHSGCVITGKDRYDMVHDTFEITSTINAPGEYYYGITCDSIVGKDLTTAGVLVVVKQPEATPGESTVVENTTPYAWSAGTGGGSSGGGGSKPSYCSTIDRGSGACAKACFTSIKKCDQCKYEHGCGSKPADEPKKNIEVELKGPDPSQKRSDGLRRVKADKEVEYKAEVDHADDDEKIEYRFKCNEDKTGRQQKVNSKKDSQKFRCTYHINKGTEKYQDPVIRVEQKDRGKAKDTKTILVYLDPLTPDPEVVNGGGDTDPPLPSAAPETDIRGE